MSASGELLNPLEYSGEITQNCSHDIDKRAFSEFTKDVQDLGFARGRLAVNLTLMRGRADNVRRRFCLLQTYTDCSREQTDHGIGGYEADLNDKNKKKRQSSK